MLEFQASLRACGRGATMYCAIRGSFYASFSLIPHVVSLSSGTHGLERLSSMAMRVSTDERYIVSQSNDQEHTR